MSIADILILAGVFLWAVIAVCRAKKTGAFRCGGNCAECAQSICQRKKQSGKKGFS